MLVIDTGMTPPSSDSVSEEKSKGNELLHLPALAYRTTGISVELEALRCGLCRESPAVRLTKNVLQKFHGPVFAAGEKTAVRLLEEGIPVADAGSGNGIEDDFEKFLKRSEVQGACLAIRFGNGGEFGMSVWTFWNFHSAFSVYETFRACR